MNIRAMSGAMIFDEGEVRRIGIYMLDLWCHALRHRVEMYAKYNFM